ncbi:MAG TPA: tripartite tricarboxylate transporter substrate binding protein [Usitatibacter sp.]|jgi:tripartite-type tricarboxylate transporter receptor subunit TctC|nr:tripartite tricarboxylate transporter substrate binding protein [Usitatibacter sp.]
MTLAYRIATVSAAALLALAPLARADWPDHPIKWVVPFSAGGANDLIARAAADGVSKRLKQTILIENKPGAGTVVGSEYAARSKPDGYTFLIASAGTITNSMILKSMPYQDSDLVPVGMIAVAPSVIVVNPAVPANNLREFVAWAKAQGGKGVNWSTAGVASTPHFVAEMLKDAGVDNLTIVPFKSGSESVTAVIAGNVQATSEASIVVIPQIKAGKLKAIADTYETRITAYNTIPTAKEQGYPGVSIGHWAGLYAPKGTPQAILDRMAAELLAVVKSKEFAGQLVPQGIEPAPLTKAGYTAFLTAERERLGKIAKKAKMQVD